MIEIFKDYQAFLERPDKSVNGVSPEFVERYPDVLLFDFSLSGSSINEGCWNCLYCKRCKNCIECDYCTKCNNCSYCSDVHNSSDCLYCMRSDVLTNCEYCVHCYNLVELRFKSHNKFDINPPIIPNIHQAVLSKVLKRGALNMSDWHTCDTKHCRAGWVVHLAGDAGYDLEKIVKCTGFAASLIYWVSSSIRVSNYQFHVNKHIAIEDMKRCAELEAALLNS